MKLTFSQSGGFAGLLRSAELDTAVLPESERRRVEQLVERSRMKFAGSRARKAAEGRDLLEYEIAVHDTDGVYTWTFDDATVPPEAAELLGYLKRLARGGP